MTRGERIAKIVFDTILFSVRDFLISDWAWSPRPQKYSAKNPVH
jgi:hypothetical protein